MALYALRELSASDALSDVVCLATPLPIVGRRDLGWLEAVRFFDSIVVSCWLGLLSGAIILFTRGGGMSTAFEAVSGAIGETLARFAFAILLLVLMGVTAFVPQAAVARLRRRLLARAEELERLLSVPRKSSVRLVSIMASGDEARGILGWIAKRSERPVQLLQILVWTLTVLLGTSTMLAMVGAAVGLDRLVAIVGPVAGVGAIGVGALFLVGLLGTLTLTWLLRGTRYAFGERILDGLAARITVADEGAWRAMGARVIMVPSERLRGRTPGLWLHSKVPVSPGVAELVVRCLNET